MKQAVEFVKMDHGNAYDNHGINIEDINTRLDTSKQNMYFLSDRLDTHISTQNTTLVSFNNALEPHTQH